MTDAEALFFKGSEYLAAGEPDAAARALHAALVLKPDFPEACANLALALERRGDPAGAEQWYRRSLALNAAIAGTHLNYGSLLAAQKRFVEAAHHYRLALAIDPASAAAWSNFGVLHASLHEDAAAERCYRAALAVNPGYDKARFNFSYLLLRQGRLREGWEAFESRPWQAWLPQELECPRWAGEPLAGKRILVCSEGGYGDMIHICRYATLLKEQGAGHVALLVYPPLERLLLTLRGVEIFGDPQPLMLSRWDYWIPAFSIPRRLRTDLDTIPGQLPYLRPDPALVARWSACLPPADGLRVGLAWKGNPRFENDADRSLPMLSALAPLADVAGVRFVSLQLDAGADEAGGPPLAHLQPAPGDFADTAAVIAQLDLVISIDSAVAHLAGALGKPCWLLLPWYKADWRWLTGRSDSPWYPGVMRLFRQPRMGDWHSVVRQVRAALAAMASGARADCGSA